MRTHGRTHGRMVPYGPADVGRWEVQQPFQFSSLVFFGRQLGRARPRSGLPTHPTYPHL